MKEKIDVFVENFKRVLIEGGAINSDKALWNAANFNNLQAATNNNLKVGEGTFVGKLTTQIKEAKSTVDGLTDEQQAALLPLMIEVISVYYVFPSNISVETKKDALSSLLAIEQDNVKTHELTADDFSVSNTAFEFGGIGSGGMGFNTNKQKEIFFLVDVFTQWFTKSEDERRALLQLDSRVGLQNFIDGVDPDRSPQCRHVLLHLLYPEYYEPIISGAQKWKICQVFKEFVLPELLAVENAPVKALHDIDQQIRVISNKLAEIRNKPTDYYSDELRAFWDSSAEGLFPDLDTELLEYKKQVVLYGPPGTGKTYTAKILASEVIRYRLAKDLGASVLNDEGQAQLKQALNNNIHRLQLHPAYSYEDFIRGLQIKGGDTVYANGYLLRLLDKMKQAPDLPHVLILDEINRVDLSRLFGECFSALENRGESIELLGSDDEQEVSLNIPDNLYIIGTMNLIDHSVEQLDFALRRRFLWVEATYNSAALATICKERWQAIKWPNTSFAWERVEDDFNKLVSAADNLNRAISNENELGRDFVLGHVFFLDTVKFLEQFLQSRSSGTSSYLFMKTGQWRDPVEKLWRLSLHPLLREYLSGLDSQAQNDIMKKLRESFKP
ncbi:MAG: AAA family ATPase [Oleispira sp.]|nr:AAA family ATPase [Oleispira sp.]